MYALSRLVWINLKKFYYGRESGPSVRKYQVWENMLKKILHSEFVSQNVYKMMRKNKAELRLFIPQITGSGSDPFPETAGPSSRAL